MAQNTPESRRLREEARTQVQDLHGFDYTAPVVYYRPQETQRRVAYKGFYTTAEALRFAIEEIPSPSLAGAYLEVEEARFGSQEIQYLYANAGYPLRSVATAA